MQQGDKKENIKGTFTMKRILLTRQLSLEIKEELVKCYIWRVVLHRAETWILREKGQKMPGEF